MREFLSLPNLLRAMGLAAVVTVMSVGRIVQAGTQPALLIAAAFLLMIFVCGMVTAWGTSAGMPGVVTDRQTLFRGTLIAAALTLVVLPFQVFWADPLIYQALLTSAKPSLATFTFPETGSGRLAVLLWAAGFQAMFLQAAPMSFFARLCNRQHIAIGFCLVFRAYITQRQITDAGITGAVPFFIISTLVMSAAGCLLFARFGLFPSIFLAMGLNLHLFMASCPPT